MAAVVTARRLRLLILRFVVPLPLLAGERRAALLRWCGMSIGAGSRIRSGSRFTTAAVSMGRECFVNFGTLFDATAPITIGDRVTFAYGVTLVTSTHELGAGAGRAASPRSDSIRIGDGCWLGARAVVLPGVTIEHGCVIGAGAVVVSDCAADGLYAGVPATRRRDLP